MKIIVDQDEVLAQFVSKVLKRWNAVNGTKILRDDINVWRMEHVLGTDVMGRSAEGLIDEWMSEPGWFDSLEPMPEALWGFEQLRKMGHDVIVATSIPGVARNAYDGKRAWMKRFFPDWSMKNFIACSRKGLLSGDILIDDGSHNIKDWTDNWREGAIVFDAPWNKDIPGTMNHCKVYRARGWRQVLSIVDAQTHRRFISKGQAEHGIIS